MSHFLKLGYHKAANMSEQEFAKLVPYPEDKPGKLLVVKHQLIPIDIQMKLIGGENHLNLPLLKNLVKTPNTLIYWRYGVEDGEKMLDKSMNLCLKIFQEKNRIPSVVEEGIAIVVYKKDVLEDHGIDLPGSFCVGVPCLRLEKKRPELIIGCSCDASQDYGSASCSS